LNKKGAFYLSICDELITKTTTRQPINEQYLTVGQLTSKTRNHRLLWD